MTKGRGNSVPDLPTGAQICILACVGLMIIGGIHSCGASADYDSAMRACLEVDNLPACKAKLKSQRPYDYGGFFR